MTSEWLAAHLFLTTLLLLVVGAYSLRQKGFAAGVPFSFALFMSAVFALLSGLDILNKSLEAKMLLMRLGMSVLPFIPVTAVGLAIEHTRHPLRNYRAPLLILLSLIPLANLGILWQDTYLPLLRGNFEIVQTSWGVRLAYQNAFWYWILYMYNAVLSLLMFVIYINAWQNSKGAYRLQTIFIMAGQGLPILGMVIPGEFAENLFEGYPIAPHLLMGTALLCGWALYRYQWLLNAPIARNVALDTIPDLLLIIDTSLRLVDMNKAASHLLKISQADVGYPMRQVLPKLETLWRSLETRESTLTREITLSENGEKQVYEIIINPVTDGQKGAVGYILLFHEHSILRMQEKQLEQIIRAIQNSPDCSFIADEQGKIVYANAAFKELTGYQADEVQGLGPSVLKSGLTPIGVYQDLWDTIRAGRIWKGEMQNRRKNGELYWDETVITPMFDGDGKVVRYMCFKKDISKQKELSNILHRRVEELALINTISLAASSKLDLHELVSLVGKHLEDSFNTTSAYVALYDPQTELIEIPYRTIRHQRVQSPPLIYGEGLTSHVIKTGQTLLISHDFENTSHALGARQTFTAAYGMPKTWLGVPIMVEQQALGVISLQNYEIENAFSEDDVRLLGTLAANIGIIMQNARLYQDAQREIQERALAEAESRRRLEQMQALYEIGQVVISGLELQSVLNTLLEKCRQIASVDVFSVATYEARTGMIEFLRFYDLGTERQIPAMDIHKTTGMTKATILEKEPIYIPDMLDQETQAAYQPIFTSQEHARSYLGLPLMIGEKVVGVLAVQCYQADAYSHEQIQTIRAIANQAAIAIENARLYEETRRRADEMHTLYQISLELSANLQLDQVLNNLLQRCLQLFHLDTLYVALYDDASNMIYYPLYYEGGKTKSIPQRNIRTGQGLTGEVILNGKTLYIADLAAPEASHRYQIIHIGGGAPAQSYLGAPLLHRGKVIGVLSIQSYESNAYTPEQIQLLETIASQAAIAIENSRSYERARKEINERRRAQESLQETNLQLQSELNRAEAMQEELREQAIRDSLTGLYNRRYLDNSFVQKISRAQRRNSPLCVIMLDIDHFKSFNDNYGHKVGDLLLQNLGKLLRTQTRASDIACRYGGEEFLILMPDTSLEIAARRAEEIRLAFEQMRIPFDHHKLHATISLGVAMYPVHGDTPEELTIQADQALYAAKSSGRNRVVVWKH